MVSQYSVLRWYVVLCARTHTPSDAHSCTHARTHTQERTSGAVAAVVVVKTISEGSRRFRTGIGWVKTG